MGARWWRAGVDDLVWTWTEGNTNAEAVLAHLKSLGLKGLRPGPDDPVVAVNNHYVSFKVVSATDAVRIRPDDWPPFADAAWAITSDVKDDLKLRALVVSEDSDRLD